MHIRIFKIQGRSEALREERLKGVRRWMEDRDWQLVDYSPELGSAVFERGEGAPALGWFDATRWLPGPDWFQPRLWLARMRVSPRRLLLAAAVGLAVVLAFSALFNFSLISPRGRGGAATRGAAETWLYGTVESLNIRAEPKPGAQIVGVLYRNQSVMVEKSSGGWARVVKPTWGFVAAKYLRDHPVQ